MTKFCDSLVKNINKNHNINNSINNIPNYEIVNNAIFTLDNNKRNVSNDDIIVVNNSYINEVNYSKVNNDDKKIIMIMIMIINMKKLKMLKI